MMVVTVHPGSQLDAFAAQTLVFLAYRREANSFDMVAEGLTPGQRAELESEVARVLPKGSATVRHAGGLFAVAVPVFDEYGICATLALLGADQMADYSEGSDAVKQLMATARALTAELTGKQAPRRIDA